MLTRQRGGKVYGSSHSSSESGRSKTAKFSKSGALRLGIIMTGVLIVFMYGYDYLYKKGGSSGVLSNIDILRTDGIVTDPRVHIKSPTSPAISAPSSSTSSTVSSSASATSSSATSSSFAAPSPPFGTSVEQTAPPFIIPPPASTANYPNLLERKAFPHQPDLPLSSFASQAAEVLRHQFPTTLTDLSEQHQREAAVVYSILHSHLSPSVAQETLLEFRCGTGYRLAQLPKHTRKICVEPNQLLRAEAAKLAVQTLAFDEPASTVKDLPDGRVNTVITFDLDKEECPVCVLRELKSKFVKTAADTRLILVTRNDAARFDRQHMVPTQAAQGGVADPVLHGFTVETLQNLVVLAGYTVKATEHGDMALGLPSDLDPTAVANALQKDPDWNLKGDLATVSAAWKKYTAVPTDATAFNEFLRTSKSLGQKLHTAYSLVVATI